MGKVAKCSVFILVVAGFVFYVSFLRSLLSQIPQPYLLIVDILVGIALGIGLIVSWSSPAKAVPERTSLVTTVVREQSKMVKKALDGSPNIPAFATRASKVQQRRFTPESIQKIKKEIVPAESETKKIAKAQELEKEMRYLEIDFKTLQELDCIIPSIEGTYNDFIKSVEKSVEILTPFLSAAEEKKAAEFLEKNQYNALVDLLENKISSHKEDPAIAPLLAELNLRRLRYGRFLAQQKGNFRSDKHSIKLYKEVYGLLQELFLRYAKEEMKSRCETFDDLLEKVSWETLEGLHFNKTLKEIGKSTMDLLVEDFLSSLKPQKRQNALEYRSLRMVFRSCQAKESLEVGQTIYKMLESMRDIYQHIQQDIAVKGQEEISKLVSLSQNLPVTFKTIPKEKVDATPDETSEKALRETIFEVNRFLGWMPQDNKLVSEEEEDLINYFSKLLYSRRTRLAIVRDTSANGEKSVFTEKLTQVLNKLNEVEQSLKTLKPRRRKKLEGVEIKIAPPRQSEEYFPLHGIIEDVTLQPLQKMNMVQLEVKEKNGLKSFVIYTGNNIQVLS